MLDRAVAVRFHTDRVDADIGAETAGEVEQAFVNILVVHVDRNGAGVAGHFHSLGDARFIVDCVSKIQIQTGDQLQFGNTVVAVEIGELGDAQAAGYDDDQSDMEAEAPAPMQSPAFSRKATLVGGQMSAPMAPSQQNPFAAPAQHAAPSYEAQAHQQYAQPQYSEQDYGHGEHGEGEELEGYDNVVYQLIPQTPPVNPADVDSGESAVEVVILWGELSILHVEHLSPPRSFYVGESTDAKGKPHTDFLIGSESLGTERMPVVVESGASVAVVIPPGAVGDITISNQVISLDELAAQGQLQTCSELAGAYQYPLPPGATARVQYRGFTFIVKPMSMARKVGIGEGQRVDWKSYMWTFASMALHTGLLLLFYFLPPRSSSLSLDLLERRFTLGEVPHRAA